MQIKSSLAAILLFLGVVFTSASILANDAVPQVPEEPLPIKGSKKTVMFPHKPHEKVECVKCHHKVDDKANFQKCSDAGCHDNLTEKKGQSSLYYVMHSKSDELKHSSCVKCHTEFVAEKPDLKKKMTGCKGSACHPDAASSAAKSDE